MLFGDNGSVGRALQSNQFTSGAEQFCDIPMLGRGLRSGRAYPRQLPALVPSHQPGRDTPPVRRVKAESAAETSHRPLALAQDAAKGQGLSDGIPSAILRSTTRSAS